MTPNLKPTVSWSALKNQWFQRSPDQRSRQKRARFGPNASKVAAEYGVGFELPASIVPNVPKNRVKVKRAKAA
jgi:hypothetical protein